MYPASPANPKISLLYERASLLAKARFFFQERGIIEVDCPLLTAAASVDAHIDLIPAIYNRKETRYLHSSPEYGMKRLLAEGMGDIYQLSHVFRDGECGAKHQPEFMLAEWYRIGKSFEAMINETVDFIRLFLGKLPTHTLSYREAFVHYAGFDYLKLTEKDLLDYIKEKKIVSYDTLEKEGKDALLNLILGTLIEPQLGQEELMVLTCYPASQAALAKTHWYEGEEVAERFEIYHRGLELANGYHELTDAKEQRLRFEQANALRLNLGKEALPIDEHFLQALEKGLPDCCGVAVGFDRLMMLHCHKSHIEDVVPQSWKES